MRNKLKDSKGVVSVFAMLAMLFFLLFIIGAYIGVSRSNKMQKKTTKELLELYSASTDPQAVYNDMISDVDQVIPVYEYDDLPTNRARFKAINGKVYYLTPKSSYELKSDIILPPGSPLYDSVYLGDYQYSLADSLKLMLDGENNSGEGHNSELQTSQGYTRYAVWKNLVNMSEECDIYSGGNARAYTTNVTWEDDSLVVDGSGMYILADNILVENTTEETIEMVFKTTTNTKKQYLFSNSSMSVGITPKSEHGHSHGVFFIEYENNGVIVTKETNVIAYNNRIYHIAATFNGTDVKLYINGVSASDATSFETQPLNFDTVPYRYKSNRFAIGLNTYIGTISDHNSTAGITVTPYFVDGYPITPTFRVRNNGTHESKITNTTAGTSQWAKDFFLNFSDLTRVNYYNLSYALKYEYEGQIKAPEMLFNGMAFGSGESDGKSLEVVAKGSNSVIIKSNVGRINNWSYGRNSTSDYNPVNPSKEVQTLGSWYYSFENLESNTSSGVKYSFKGEYELNAGNLLSVDLSTLYIGRRYNTMANDSFVGQVYAVRAYDKALTEDNVQTNYRIDQTKYGIN